MGGKECSSPHVPALGRDLMANATSQTPAVLPPGNLTIVQEAEWDSGPVWKGTENLSLTGIRSPNFPAHGESLYQSLTENHS